MLNDRHSYDGGDQRVGMTISSLWPFLAITFGLTWGIAALAILFPDQVTAVFGEMGMTNPLFLCAVYAPAIAAFILVIYGYGADGLRRYLSRLLLWRCPIGWYVFLLVGIPALMYCAVALKGTLGDTPFPFSPWYHVFPALGLALVVGPIEEFGWRGLALPLLQQKYAPLWAGLVLGGIWAVWHIPAFLLGGTPQSAWSFTPYFLAIFAISVIMTALFNASRGSLLLPALLHFQLNNPTYPDAQPYDLVTVGLAAVLVVVLNRQQMLRRDGAATEVVPSAPQ
jgi:membrane protease YdiL (CAAX protease family)